MSLNCLGNIWRIFQEHNSALLCLGFDTLWFYSHLSWLSHCHCQWSNWIQWMISIWVKSFPTWRQKSSLSESRFRCELRWNTDIVTSAKFENHSLYFHVPSEVLGFQNFTFYNTRMLYAYLFRLWICFVFLIFVQTYQKMRPCTWFMLLRGDLSPLRRWLSSCTDTCF